MYLRFTWLSGTTNFSLPFVNLKALIANYADRQHKLTTKSGRTDEELTLNRLNSTNASAVLSFHWVL